MPNPLDQCSSVVSIIRPGTNTCAVTPPSYPSCTDLLNICFCDRPIIPPPEPETKCVNDITKRPWPPPPPADPGCNPFTVSITNRQDETANSNISLRGKVNYVGGDPCLPQLDLELLTSPTFFSGGGSPEVRGWGVSLYGRVVGICPESCPNCVYKNAQQFFAQEPGAAAFYPQNINCSSNYNTCDFLTSYARQVAKFNLIGPILGEIQGTAGVRGTWNGIPFAWEYNWSPANCVIAGNQCVSCPSDLQPTYPNNLPGTGSNRCYNVKENLSGFFNSGILTPGVDLNITVELGLKPQPLAPSTQVLLYGWVAYDPETSGGCGCPIVWFVDVPNALAGECEDNTQQAASSMLPTRNITSAGMFFGSNNDENRV